MEAAKYLTVNPSHPKGFSWRRQGGYLTSFDFARWLGVFVSPFNLPHIKGDFDNDAKRVCLFWRVPPFWWFFEGKPKGRRRHFGGIGFQKKSHPYGSHRASEIIWIYFGNPRLHGVSALLRAARADPGVRQQRAAQHSNIVWLLLVVSQAPFCCLHSLGMPSRLVSGHASRVMPKTDSCPVRLR